MELGEYQARAVMTEPEVLERNLTNPLTGAVAALVECTSSLAAFHNRKVRNAMSNENLRDRATELLGQTLWHLSETSRRLEIPLEEAAQDSLQRLRKEEFQSPRTLPDESFPDNERFPRRMDAEIREEGDKAVTRINGTVTGDPLDDNQSQEDWYRFHDVFHLAHAAVLGWSPTLRALMNRQRSGGQNKLSRQDGRGAIRIEEGLTAMVFSHAEGRGFYESVYRVDPEILRTLRGMTSHTEIADATDSQWERTILTGYRAWRFARDNGGGRFRADLDQGTLEIVGKVQEVPGGRA